MFDVISKREFEKDGFTYIVSRVSDVATSPSDYTDPNRYEGVPTAERAKYEAEDAKRAAAYERGEWEYIGVTVSIRKQTVSNWADGGLEVGRASVWGIESDSEEPHLLSMESETIADAEHELSLLRAALAAD